MGKRVFLVVLDSVGIGHAKDAQAFGDQGANTLGHLSEQYNLCLPTMQKLGLGNIYPLESIAPTDIPQAFYTYMEPLSVGKDSIAGHWEFMGSILKEPFNNFTAHGFPDELIKLFEKETGRKVLANKEANGLQVIHEYADLQKETGDFIVYTSVDSTFQIAAHEEWIGLEALYKASEVARKLTLSKPEWLVSRVIARPFIGENGKYTRTGNRHDYALSPYDKIILEDLKKNGLDVIALGKINDLYNNVGISHIIPTKSNVDGIEQLKKIMEEDFNGLAFLNLVEFDSLYGHPRNPQGYKEALEYWDNQLVDILDQLREEDVLIITADHGNDPTFPGNDHTRENVPLLIYSKSYQFPREIRKRETFADLGKTIADILEVSTDITVGTSFAQDLK